MNGGQDGGSFQEGRLIFDWGPGWLVAKYDDHPDYRHGILELPGSKGMDFVALHRQANVLYLIEVKDYRWPQYHRRERIGDVQLAVMVGQKARDTVAGIVGAAARGHDEDLWQPMARSLADGRTSLRVLLWIEEHAPKGGQDAILKARRSILLSLLKRRLSWLTTRVFVASQPLRPHAPPGLAVRDGIPPDQPIPRRRDGHT